jgi:hypothetical protein
MKKYFLILLLFCQSAFADDEINQSTIADVISDYFFDDEDDDDDDDYNYEADITIKSHSRFAAEIAFDDNFSANDRRNEFKDSNFRVRFNNSLSFGEGISLNSNIVLNRFDNIDQTDRRNNSIKAGDRSFENIGVVLREFNISKNAKNYALIAGKINLNFGSAWRWNRGIWIHDLANNNYRQVEKLGFVGIYRAGDSKKTGQYNFSLSSFTNDRKNFDNTLFVNRNSDKKSDASAGDTRSLQSYAAMLDINFDFGDREKLSYQFSYLNLAVNERAMQISSNKVDDEKDFVLNMDYHYPLNNEILLNGFIEYAEVKNLNGNSDFGERYLTTNLNTKFGEHWNVLLGNSRRQNLQLGANGFDQNLSEISLGYEFKKNRFFDRLTIQGGYKYFRNDQRTFVDSRNAVGFLMRYYKNF